MARTDTPPPPEPSAEQAAALAEAQAADDAEHSRAKSKELVEIELVAGNPSVHNFVVYSTRTVSLPDPNKSDGSTIEREVEYPIIVKSGDRVQVPAGLVDSIREAAHRAGLAINVSED